MRVGTLNKLITIEQPQEQRDAAGGVTMTWGELTRAWAGINSVSGTEKYISAERHSEATHQITMRYIAEVTPKMRVVYGSRVFVIISVIDPGERNKTLQLVVKEWQDD